MIEDILKELEKELESLDIDERINMLNVINKKLSELSPMNEPITYVKWVKAENVDANEYNPNKVATPEMNLLYESINSDGYTQPIVAYQKDATRYEIVDGFHRNRVGKEHKDIYERLHGYLPLTIIDKPLDERMGSTIRHNRARGSHQIRSMSDIVVELSSEGWTDDEICTKLGMDMDEVLRLKQVSGLKAAFSNHEFSKTWEEYKSKLKEESEE